VTAQIHFINGNGGTQDVGSSSSGSADSASSCSIMWAFFQQNKTDQLCLRSTVSQDRFQNLAIHSIENKVPSSTYFSDVIKDFAAIKSRKVQF
jgi:hypothetical protein